MSHSSHFARKKAHEAIDALPPESLQELSRFLEFLRFRQRAPEDPMNVQLEGLWQDKQFDVTDDDIRALRQQVSDHVLQRAK